MITLSTILAIVLIILLILDLAPSVQARAWGGNLLADACAVVLIIMLLAPTRL